MANATGANVLANYDGWFKEIYSSKGLEEAIPTEALLTQLVKFVPNNERIGDSFHRPVRLQDEQGMTFGDGTGAPEMNAAIAGQTKDAVITSAELAIRGRLGYATMSRATDKGSFGSATGQLMTSLRRSIGKKLEIEMLYGSASIGQVASEAAGVVTITTSEWAPYIWIGQEGMAIEFFDQVSGGTSQATATVASVDMENKQVTVTGVTGTIEANDYIFFGGSVAGSEGIEQEGLHNILGNTGTLFGIDGSNFSAWQGNVHTVAAPGKLTYAEIGSAVLKAVSKGMTGEATLLVSFATWEVMNTDIAALRVLDDSYKAFAEIGQSGFKIHAQNGVLNVRPSGFVKEGYAYIFRAEDYQRIGSREVSFEIPGRPGRFVMDLENHMAVEWRAYTDQALFTTRPAHGVRIEGLIN